MMRNDSGELGGRRIAQSLSGLRMPSSEQDKNDRKMNALHIYI